LGLTFGAGQIDRAEIDARGSGSGYDGGDHRSHAERDYQVGYILGSGVYSALMWSRTKMIEDSKRPEPRFRGMNDAVRTIVKEEGYLGIYRGLGPVVRERQIVP
jgi:hypothetical protein